MKHLLVTPLLPRLLLRPFLAGTCAAFLALPSAHAAEEAAKPVATTVGADFTVELEANPTTGYQWQLHKPLDGLSLEAAGKQYQAPPQPVGKPPMVGVGGKEVWTFKALRAGETSIELKYVRPWEADAPPVKTAVFQVVIKDAAQPAAPAPADEPLIKEGAEVVLTGQLEGGIMAIGGETTGWRLAYATKAGKQSIEVDCSTVPAENIPEGAERVTGTVITKNYVERGPTLILKATKVEKQPALTW